MYLKPLHVEEAWMGLYKTTPSQIKLQHSSRNKNNYIHLIILITAGSSDRVSGFSGTQSCRSCTDPSVISGSIKYLFTCSSASLTSEQNRKQNLCQSFQEQKVTNRSSVAKKSEAGAKTNHLIY